METQKFKRFDFKIVKAFQAIRWMLHIAPERKSDFHTICKACFFADEEVLNLRGRPIFGDEYRSMKFGPVPLGIYEMLKCEPSRLMEMKFYGIESYPWEMVDRYDVVLTSIIDLSESHWSHISQRELEIIEDSFEKSSSMSFEMRTSITHGLAWKNGKSRDNNLIFYEDMLREE